MFNLSSEDRLVLLDSISSEHQRLTNLSKVISASAQECSRHLSRLVDSGFVKRDAEGYYELTPLGKSILAIFPSIRFLLKHRDYFLAHDLSYLPQDYTERIGELSSGEYVNHVSLVLELIKAVISKARKYVLLVSDQPIVVGNVGSSFYTRDIPVRLLGEQNIDRNIVAGIKSALSRAEVATVEQIRVAMAINENLAGVCFPGIGGKIDFAAGFSGSDPRFLTWCKDLFEFYWNKSRKI